MCLPQKIGGRDILNSYFSKKMYTLVHQNKYLYMKNQIYLPIKSIYLVFPSWERQRRLIQAKLYDKLLYSLEEETFHKLLKVAAAKKSYRTMYIIDKTYFHECSLVHVIIGRNYFLYKFSITQRFGAIAILLRSLRLVFWKRSALYAHYLQNNTLILLISKVRNKCSSSYIFFKKSVCW